MANKDYNSINFRNSAIDRMSGKFGKGDEPKQRKGQKNKSTVEEVSLKDNAEKRMADKIRKSGYSYTSPNVDDSNTKIASLKDTQSKTYVSFSQDKKPLPNTLASGNNWYKFLNDAEKNTEATRYDKKSGTWTNTQQKLKTLAPSYVEPTGPKTLQGVKTKKNRNKK